MPTDQDQCLVCGHSLGVSIRTAEAHNEICPSCGIQYGYSNSAGGSAEKREKLYAIWREAWILNARKPLSNGQIKQVVAAAINMGKVKQVFIYCDLNKLTALHYYPITNAFFADQIKEQYGGIVDGMRIWLYSDTFKNKKFDPTLYPGTIRIAQADSKVIVDESEMEYLSESKKFKEYTIEDVIGIQSFHTLKEKHPEWF